MPIFNALRASLVGAGLALVSALSACSPGAFSGNDKDEELAKRPGYRQIDKACSDMSLAQSELKPTEFRTLLKCLNGTGALEPAASMILKLEDPEIKTLLDVFNTHILSNRTRMYEVDVTYRQLSERGQLAPAFASAGRLLENSELITQSITMLERAYRIDPRLALGALQKVSDRLGTNRVEAGIDDALSLTGAPVFGSLQEHFRGEGSSGRRLEDLSARAVDAAAAVRNGVEPDLIRESLGHFVDGKLHEVHDEAFGNTPTQIRSRLGQVSPLFDRLLQDNAHTWNGIIDFVGSTHTSLFCAGGAMQIPDLTRFALDELYLAKSETIVEHLQRTKPLQFSTYNAICPLPAAFTSNYHHLLELADSPAIVPGHKLVLSVRDHGLEAYLLQLFGARGTDGQGGIRRFLPLLSELSDRGAVSDLFLLVTSVRPQDRGELTEALKFALEPDARMSGRSLYDVMQISLARANPLELAKLLRSLQPLIDQDEPVIQPALMSLRKIVRSNDAHPGIDFLRETLAEAPSHQAFLEVLFKLSAMPEFRKSIELLAAMSKDHRLEDILDVVNALFRRYSSQGHVRDIVPAEIPGFVPRRAHDLVARDLVPLAPSVHPVDLSDPCRALNPGVPLLNPGSAGYDTQIANLVACVGRAPGDAPQREALEYLRTQRMTDGRSAFSFHLDLLSKIHFAREQTRDLFRRLFRAVDDGQAAQALRLVPFLVVGQGDVGPVLRPLLDAVKPMLVRSRQEVRRLLDYSSTLLKQASLTQALKYLDTLRSAGALDPIPVPALAGDEGFRAQIRNLVRYRECIEDPVAIERRAGEVIDDYLNASNNWELLNGRTRRSWTRPEFHAGLRPFLNKFADPVGQGPALPNLLAVVRSFTLEPGQAPVQGKHFTRDYFGKWLSDRSNDEKPILYYYPDEDKARVRMVSSLDRLELVLYNADFQYAEFLIPGNHGFRYLARIGEAWGDEDREAWPLEIQVKYPDPRHPPPKLSAVYKDMKKELERFGGLAGYPRRRECRPDGLPEDGIHMPDPGLIHVPGFLAPPGLEDVKRRLFNLTQVLPVVEENLPGANHPNAGGMRVLRNLFWELYSSSPADARNPSAGERNNLWVITQLIHMGFIREISKTLRIEPDSQARQEFFRGFVAGATAPSVQPILDTLFVEHPDQKLLWKGIDQVFAHLGEDAESQARLRQLGFYAVGLLGTRQFALAEPVLAALGPVIRQNYDYILAHESLIGELFENQELVSWVHGFSRERDSSRAQGREATAAVLRDAVSDPTRALDLFSVVRAVEQDPVGHAGWTDFRARWSAIRATSDWQRQGFDEVGRRGFDFLTEEGSPGTAQAVREYLSTLVKSPRAGQPSDLEQELDLIARDPQRFNQVLNALSSSSRNGELQSFLDEARRALIPIATR